MTSKDRARLAKLLESLDPGERRRVFKKATQLRKRTTLQSRRPRPRGAAPEDEPLFTKKRDQSGGALSLDDWVLRILLEEQAVREESHAEGPGDSGAPSGSAGLVVSVETGACHVQVGDELVRCDLAPEIAAEQKTRIAVGDHVLLEERSGAAAMVRLVLPRKTTLSRNDPHTPGVTRVIAANIDVVVLVASFVAPPLHTGLLDRILIAIGRGGARPVLCINKLDLLTDDAVRESELAKLAPYQGNGLAVHCCSAGTGEGVPELLRMLADSLCVFFGHSGVGKSSLLNAMRPELRLQTNTLRAADGKGRHTTTASTLYRLPGGARVIDTPGIREFGLEGATRGDVAAHFAEFGEFAKDCRFSNCTHTHEPGCAVKEAVRAGRISMARYASYRSLA